jgi:hypothetical protein
MESLKQSSKFTVFLFSEGIVWLVLLALAPFLILPSGIWHGDLSGITWFELLLIAAFVGGTVYYLYRLVTYTATGKLIQRELLTLQLPIDQKQTISLAKYNRGNIVIFLHNANLSWLHGQITVKSEDGAEVLSQKELREPKGRTVKKLGGGEHTVLGGKRSATADRVAMLSFTKQGSSDEVTLDLDLAWNFQGWNSALEQRLPKDKKLTLEVLVRAA